jgi:(R,R)-butanediol dehydrogenase/meso-butanediol dehydrogenase/diacetyl reductase
MKAAVFRGAGKPLAVETLDDPKPGRGELVLKVHRCGICSSDLHMTSGHAFDYAPGSVMGHEYAGEIVELGAGVEGFRKGDLITAIPAAGCGHCEACAEGNWYLCPNTTGAMGGYGQYMKIPAAAALKLPGALSMADGALVEPMAVGRYAVRGTNLRAGDRILVLGGGPVALAVIFWARRLGAGRIVAASRSERRAAMTLAMGADAFVQSGEAERQEFVEALGGAPDIVFECVGVEGQLQRAIEHVRIFGQVVSMGFCTSPDAFLPALAGMKSVRLSFPTGSTLRDFQQVADLWDAGHADPKMMITSETSLDDLPTVFEALRGPNDETKVHITPG